MSGNNVLLDERRAAQTERDDGTDLLNCHDRSIMQGTGSDLRWQPSFKFLDGHAHGT